jgi:hypothetical protein
MRRTIFLALLAALLFVSAAHAAGSTKIIRDCADDGILQGSYSASQLRKAINDIPAELDEYSDCRDVLSRALAARASTSGGGGGTSSGGPPGSAGGTGGPAASGELPTPPGVPAAVKGRDPGVRIGPSTPQDWHAVDSAAAHGADPVAINGRRVSPAASVGRNGLPGTVIAVLALLAAAAAASLVPFVRRRVSARPLA